VPGRLKVYTDAAAATAAAAAAAAISRVTDAGYRSSINTCRALCAFL